MQVPQYILEDAVACGTGALCHVVCTQPRRVAAISVAQRVADERGEPPPGEPGSKVSPALAPRMPGSRQLGAASASGLMTQ